MLTIGKGQRMGIFAGSGVGKSTLMGMIARNIKADVNVIALVGCLLYTSRYYFTYLSGLKLVI